MANSEHIKTARAFESLCRLAEAHAKLMMREKTSTFDCMSAILTNENKYFSTF
jgi:DNA replicative helicase MCM subunit Mcm2 (Cdc46/Mcm family)